MSAKRSTANCTHGFIPGQFAEALERQGGNVQVVVTERGLALGAEHIAAGGAPGTGLPALRTRLTSITPRGTGGQGAGGPRPV
jgi:hypothetical protein